jgi:recombination protein RecT
MIRIALTELRKTPRLQQCDPMSFMGAIVQACQLGLEPGGALGHCYLIPYGKECQLQLGYRGMVDLARRSGNIVSISARCVYEGDHFGFELGTEEFITHTPKFSSTNITHVYAVAKLKDGGTQFEIMSIGEINHLRDTYSAGYKRDPKGSPWLTAPDEMAKKTVVRRLFKMLPTSIEIREAIQLDDDEEQHNAKVIDPSYEVLPAAVDMDKFHEALNGKATPMAGAASDADRKIAVDEFNKARFAYKGNPEKALGKSIDDVLRGDPGAILAAADVLSAGMPS